MSADNAMDMVSYRTWLKGPYVGLIVFQSDGPVCPPAAASLVDAVVVDSTFLRTRVPLKFNDKVHYIPDALEFPWRTYQAHEHPKKPLRLVWMGAGGNYFFAEPIVTGLRKAGWDVGVVCEDPVVATDIWTIEGHGDVLNRYDVGITPYPENLAQADTKSFVNFWYKDNNRVATMQAAGLPVIASPLPSFLQYINHGQDGLIANSLEDWVNCLIALQEDPVLYTQLAQAGYLKAYETAESSKVGQRWFDLIKQVDKASAYDHEINVSDFL